MVFFVLRYFLFHFLNLLLRVGEHIGTVNKNQRYPVVFHVFYLFFAHVLSEFCEEVFDFFVEVFVVNKSLGVDHVKSVRVQHRVENKVVIQVYTLQEEKPESRFDAFLGQVSLLYNVKGFPLLFSFFLCFGFRNIVQVGKDTRVVSSCDGILVKHAFLLLRCFG